MMTQNEIDMSPGAVAARLEDVRALYRLVLYLGRFKALEAAQAQGAERPGQRSRG
jgi:hypothetical protein